MMNKRFVFLTLMAALVCQITHAVDTYTTKGDGTTYSIQTLAEINESGVIAYDIDVDEWRTEYELQKSITIAAGDKFVMDDALVVFFNKDVCLTIEGEANFKCDEGSIFKAFDEISGSSVRLKCNTTTEMSTCKFYTVGVEVMGEGAINMYNCYFKNHDGLTAAALYFISNGAPSIIQYCEFHSCQKAAIGSAANASRPLTIKYSIFNMNSAANGNIPQINITAANPLVVDDNTVEGNPENTMVGGIGISNFMGYDADITIKNCRIKDNRYGIGIVGPAAKIRIENNLLIDNCHETNPMNGGSGVSLYDPYQQTEAMITGNHIKGSLWGITVIGCKDVNLGRIDVPQTDEHYNPGENIFLNNGNNGELYDLYNNSANTVYAQGNRWNVSEQTQEQIETVIYHKHDNSSLGEVIYWPAATTTNIGDMSEEERSVEGNCYDLQGRKVTKQLKTKGIYIVNGKKVVR